MGIALEYVEFDCWRCKDTGEYEVSMPPYDIDTALCTCDAGKQLAKERKLKLEDTQKKRILI